MVILAITPSGLRQALQLPQGSTSVWCGSDAISESEYKALSRDDVSRFAYPLARESADTLTAAIHTIEEHHPSETVWVQHIFPS